MGKCETATAAIGIKILLGDLLLQINETNFDLIKKMLYHGCIEDSNGYYNEVYKNIVGYGIDDNELPDNYNKCKEYLLDTCQKIGSYNKSKFTNEVEPDLSKGCLLEQPLLVPIKDILTTERWGYERHGINSKSRPLDFDLSLDLADYSDIKHYNIIFFVNQQT